MEWWMNSLLAVAGYLIGMAFAGSFLGRKWMGTVDVFLHKRFKIDITIGKYLYWKYFCNISDPPKPEKMKKPDNFLESLIAKVLI
jgi:hypothetical protein